MASNDKNDRKKVALDEETYRTLKDFSRFNGLKLRIVIDAFAELLLEDETFKERVIQRTLGKQSNDG